MAIDNKKLSELISLLEDAKQILIEERLRRRLESVVIQPVLDNEEE